MCSAGCPSPRSIATDSPASTSTRRGSGTGVVTAPFSCPPCASCSSCGRRARRGAETRPPDEEDATLREPEVGQVSLRVERRRPPEVLAVVRRRGADDSPDLQGRQPEPRAVRRRAAQSDPAGPEHGAGHRLHGGEHGVAVPAGLGDRAAHPRHHPGRGSRPSSIRHLSSSPSVTSRVWSSRQDTSTPGAWAVVATDPKYLGQISSGVRSCGWSSVPAGRGARCPVRRPDRGGHHVPERQVVPAREGHPHHAVPGEPFVVAFRKQRLGLQRLHGLARCCRCHASSVGSHSGRALGASASNVRPRRRSATLISARRDRSPPLPGWTELHQDGRADLELAGRVLWTA